MSVREGALQSTPRGSVAWPDATLKTARGVEIRFDHAGEVDEIVAVDQPMHLEYLSNQGLIMLIVGDLHINLWTRGRGQIYATVLEPSPWPLH